MTIQKHFKKNLSPFPYLPYRQRCVKILSSQSALHRINILENSPDIHIPFRNLAQKMLIT